jgi:thiol-disulfide isomerase/thioredoxin
MTESPRVRAPEFPRAEWLNVAAPLSLKSLRGKVVLLDFWTYGCINCMHVIPDLKRLEEKYAEELVVIGVHSAKFTNEKNTENLRRILVRYDIDHPVVNDAEFTIWRSYGARAWPTLVLIDPEGYVVGAASGEGHGDGFDRAIAAVIHVFDERGLIDRTPLPPAPKRARRWRRRRSPFPARSWPTRASVGSTSPTRVIIASSSPTSMAACCG